MRIADRLQIKDKRTTRDGYLVTEAKFARAGIYNYSGRDVGKPEMDVVRVYRPEAEVFHADAMGSFAHRPITNDHPDDFVDSGNWRDHAVGFSDGKVARDGDFVVIPMMVTDAAAVDDVLSGKAELSAGYDCDLEFVDGATEAGDKYDAIMTNIRGNHIAIVDRGRAGPDCRIGDQKEPTMNLTKIMLADAGIEIETTPQGAQAIQRLEGALKDKASEIERLTGTHTAAIEAKDKELAGKDAEIAELKGKVLDAAALDKLVSERASLVTTAKRLVADFDATGKTAAEIKRAVVASKCGDAAAKDKSDAYIDARFDGLVEGLGEVDAIRDALTHTGPTSASVTQSVADAKREEQAAFDKSVDYNAWRNGEKK